MTYFFELFEIEFFGMELFDHLNVCKQMTDVTFFVLHSNTCKHLNLCKKGFIVNRIICI